MGLLSRPPPRRSLVPAASLRRFRRSDVASHRLVRCARTHMTASTHQVSSPGCAVLKESDLRLIGRALAGAQVCLPLVLRASSGRDQAELFS